MFEEHPDHDRAGEDAIVEFGALGDVIAFLTIGDLVLGSIATLFLGRWVREFDDTILACISPPRQLTSSHMAAQMHPSSRRLVALTWDCVRPAIASWPIAGEYMAKS